MHSIATLHVQHNKSNINNLANLTIQFDDILFQISMRDTGFLTQPKNVKEEEFYQLKKYNVILSLK